VTANAFGGAGGNILIVADNFLASADSAVSASSEFGVDGQIVIRSPEDTVIVGVEALPESFLDVSSLLSERCAARTAAKVGSFVVLGRGGVPPEPDAALPSFYADSDTQTDTRSTSSSTDSHAAGRGTIVVDTGQRRVSGAQAVNSIMPARLLFSCGD
jgi:large exoprotein involved in heme utilization and adhesion